METKRICRVCGKDCYNRMCWECEDNFYDALDLAEMEREYENLKKKIERRKGMKIHREIEIHYICKGCGHEKKYNMKLFEGHYSTHSHYAKYTFKCAKCEMKLGVSMWFSIETGSIEDFKVYEDGYQCPNCDARFKTLHWSTYFECGVCDNCGDYGEECLNRMM